MRPVKLHLDDDEGFTLVEMAIAAMLSLVILALLTGLLSATFRTSNFTQGHSFTLDDARTTLHQVERDIQNATYIEWCDTSGGCLELVTFSPHEDLRRIRYEVDGATLLRANWDEDADAFGSPAITIEHLKNPATGPVFTCDLQTSLLRVNVDLWVQPHTDEASTYHLKTSVRPRNFPSNANCP